MSPCGSFVGHLLHMQLPEKLARPWLTLTWAAHERPRSMTLFPFQPRRNSWRWIHRGFKPRRELPVNTYVSCRIGLHDDQLHRSTCPPPTASLKWAVSMATEGIGAASFWWCSSEMARFCRHSTSFMCQDLVKVGYVGEIYSSGHWTEWQHSHVYLLRADLQCIRVLPWIIPGELHAGTESLWWITFAVIVIYTPAPNSLNSLCKSGNGTKTTQICVFVIFLKVILYLQLKDWR